MADNGNQRETFQCSRCKKRFFEDGFKINRLGRRLKTCLECNARQAVESQRNKCPHGRQRYYCRECGGVGVCHHGRRRSHCRECGGASICEHNRRREECRECGGSQICEHSRQRNRCWDCDPVGALWSRANNRIVKAIGTEARAGRSTEALLGCDKETFFHYIGAQFDDGMIWARIGEIDIDHRIPIEYPSAAGGPPTLEEKVARLDYRNCKPMWAPDNLAKGNRWADPLPEAPLPEAPLPEATLPEAPQPVGPLPEPPAPGSKGPQLTDDEVTTLLAEFGFLS